jgi:hypothetical protein
VEIVTDDGDVWDAIERSCRVNTTHGKRRAPADTKRAIEMILEVMRHRGEKWSNVEIAERCAVHPSTVSRILPDLSIADAIDSDTPTTVTRNGTTYEIDTTNIGRWRAPNLDAHPEIEAEQVDPGDIDTYQWSPPERLRDSTLWQGDEQMTSAEAEPPARSARHETRPGTTRQEKTGLTMAVRAGT